MTRLYLTRAATRLLPFAAATCLCALYAYAAVTTPPTTDPATLEIFAGLMSTVGAILLALGVWLASRRPKQWRGLTREDFRRQRQIIHLAKRLRRQQRHGVRLYRRLLRLDPTKDVLVMPADENHTLAIIDHASWRIYLQDFWYFVRDLATYECRMWFNYHRGSDDHDIRRPTDRTYTFFRFTGAIVTVGNAAPARPSHADYKWLHDRLQAALDPPGL